MKRLAISIAIAAMPLSLALATACSVDGATPDCSQQGARCEPSADNANPDARPDVKADGPIDTGNTTDTGATDAPSDARDASDAATDARDSGDAKLDGTPG